MRQRVCSSMRIPVSCVSHDMPTSFNTTSPCCSFLSVISMGYISLLSAVFLQPVFCIQQLISSSFRRLCVVLSFAQLLADLQIAVFTLIALHHAVD